MTSNRTMYKVITMETLLGKQAAALLEEAANYRKAAQVMVETLGHKDRLYAKADALETWAGKILQSLDSLTMEQREQNIEVHEDF